MQGEFTISRLAVSPQVVYLDLPKNYEQTVTITITVTAADGTTAENVRLEYLAADQPGGDLSPLSASLHTLRLWRFECVPLDRSRVPS